MLNLKEREKLPDSVFASPTLRLYPLIDASHVRMAILQIIRCPSNLCGIRKQFRREIHDKIEAKANEFGVSVPHYFFDACVNGREYEKRTPFIFR